MMTIQSPHFLCGNYCISSLTWAGGVAYLSRWHAKASVRDKQGYDSHVFFVPVRVGSVTGQKKPQNRLLSESLISNKTFTQN